MKYNSQREKLILAEYGRIVQDMVDYAVTLPEKADRQRCAERIVAVMGQMIPKSERSADFETMLWDHLALISNYKLDIDWPYEVTRHDKDVKPAPIPYPMSKISHRHYGHLLEKLVKAISEMPDGPVREHLTALAANQMRKNLFYWNKTSLNEQRIADDIFNISSGSIVLEKGDITYSSNVPNGNSNRKVQRSKNSR